MRPGGYLELQDNAPFEYIDDSGKGSAFRKWTNACLEGAAKLGRRFDLVSFASSFHLFFSSLLVSSNSGRKRFGFDISSSFRDLTARQTPHYKSYLEEIGFVDIVEKQFAFPIGPWAKGAHMKAVGELCKADLVTGIHGISMMVLRRGMGMTAEEVETLITEAKDEMNSKKLHAYMPM